MAEGIAHPPSDSTEEETTAKSGQPTGMAWSPRKISGNKRTIDLVFTSEGEPLDVGSEVEEGEIIQKEGAQDLGNPHWSKSGPKGMRVVAARREVEMAERDNDKREEVNKLGTHEVTPKGSMKKKVRRKTGSRRTMRTSRLRRTAREKQLTLSTGLR